MNPEKHIPPGVTAFALSEIWMKHWANIEVTGRENLDTLAEYMKTGYSVFLTPNHISMFDPWPSFQILREYIGDVVTKWALVAGNKFAADGTYSYFGKVLQKVAKHEHITVFEMIQPYTLRNKNKNNLDGKEEKRAEIAKLYQPILDMFRDPGTAILAFIEGSRSRDGVPQPPNDVFTNIFGEKGDPALIESTVIMPIAITGTQRILDAHDKLHFWDLLRRTPIHIAFGRPIRVSEILKVSQEYDISPNDVIMLLIADLLPKGADKGRYGTDQFPRSAIIYQFK